MLEKFENGICCDGGVWMVDQIVEINLCFKVIWFGVNGFLVNSLVCCDYCDFFLCQEFRYLLQFFFVNSYYMLQIDLVEKVLNNFLVFRLGIWDLYFFIII